VSRSRVWWRLGPACGHCVVLWLLVTMAAAGCGHAATAQSNATPAHEVASRVLTIANMLHGWASYPIASSSAGCHLSVESAPLASRKREFDYPKTGAVRQQVDVSVTAFRSPSTARAWITLAQGPRGRRCIREWNEQHYSAKLRKRVRAVAVPGLPAWLHISGVPFLHGFTVIATSGNFRLVVIKAEFEDRTDPRITYDVAVLALGHAPRTLPRRIVGVGTAK